MCWMMYHSRVEVYILDLANMLCCYRNACAPGLPTYACLHDAPMMLRPTQATRMNKIFSAYAEASVLKQGLQYPSYLCLLTIPTHLCLPTMPTHKAYPLMPTHNTYPLMPTHKAYPHMPTHNNYPLMPTHNTYPLMPTSDGKVRFRTSV